MRKSLHLLAAACLALLLLAVSCSKEISDLTANETTEAPGALIASAKKWCSDHLNHPSASQIFPPEQVKREFPPEWEKSRMIRTSRGVVMLVVASSAPPMRYINRGFGRFFVFPVSNHHIIDGGMVEFIGQNYDVWDNIDFLLKNFDQDTIPGFNGIVARYDIYRTPTSGIVYRNGQKAKNVRTEIVRVRGKDMERLASTPVLDSLPVQDGQ